MKFTVSKIGSAIALISFIGTAHADLPKPPGSNQTESTCGVEDYQNVEQYNGTLGPSVNYVNNLQSAVGQIQWNTNLSSRYTRPGNVSGVRWCTGTLVGKTTFITAGHCFDRQTNDGAGWDFPIDNATGTEITSQQAAREMHINFNYQHNATGTLRTAVEFPVVSLREYRLGNQDYAILQLGTNSSNTFPGDQFGITSVSTNIPGPGELLTIIQHPRGIPKVIEAGNYFGEDSLGRMLYTDLDTDGGSSGSGVLSPNSLLVGIHTNGGCTSSGGTNSGYFIADIAAISSEVKLLSMSRVQNLWKPEQVINVETGTPSSSAIGAGALSSHWSFEKIDDFYRIRNRWTGGYLHMETGTLSSGNILGGWHSAMWKLTEGTLNGNKYYRIENRWQPGKFLNIENGPLVASNVPSSFWSSWWSLSNI